MKFALFLTMLCAVALLNGCSTNRGGTTDDYSLSSGSDYNSPGSPQETEPSVADPSLPRDTDLGPQAPPPAQDPNPGPQIPPP